MLSKGWLRQSNLWVQGCIMQRYEVPLIWIITVQLSVDLVAELSETESEARTRVHALCTEPQPAGQDDPQARCTPT